MIMKITLLILLSIFTLSARGQVYESDEAQVSEELEWKNRPFQSNNTIRVNLNDSTLQIRGDFTLDYRIQRYLYDLYSSDGVLVHYYEIKNSFGHRDILMLGEMSGSIVTITLGSYRKETVFIYNGKMFSGIEFNNIRKNEECIY